VGIEAFRGCSALQSAVISGLAKGLLQNAFLNCSALKEVYLSETIINIGYGTFRGCLSLKKITCLAPSTSVVYSTAFGESEGDWAGRNTYNTGENMLYVPAGATGYDTGAWLDPLCTARKCGFTLSATL
jgi:hypothetical protein